MKIKLQKWEALDVRVLAEMTTDVRKQEGLGDYTVDQLEEYLNLMNDRFPAEVVAVALQDGAVRGWMGLERTTKEIGEVGRWHPFVGQVPQREDVAKQLISEVNRYALENGIRRIEVGFGEISDSNREAFSQRQSWYEVAGWNKLEEDLFMGVNPKDKHVMQEPKRVSEYDVLPLVDVSEGKLYDCYHQAFMTGEAVWIYEMTEEQRRQEFDKNFNKSNPINREASFALVKDDEVAGFILVLSRSEEEEYIESLGVHPSHRRKGLAKFLLSRVIEVLREKRANNLTLGVDSVNKPAINLYEQVGFQTISRTVRYSWKDS
jgi:ribosomal protein S18 acetylase RimI-like enzyme